MGNRDEKIVDHLKTDKQDVRPIGDFRKENFGWLEVEHGLDDDGNYVWHFSSHHRAKPFPNDQETIIRVLITYLNKVIPEGIPRDLYPSPESWEKKVITVKARGWGKKWNFDEEEAVRVLPDIGDYITKLIDKAFPKRTRL